MLPRACHLIVLVVVLVSSREISHDESAIPDFNSTSRNKNVTAADRKICEGICVPKCCNTSQVLNVSDLFHIQCSDSVGKKWVPTIYADPYTKLSGQPKLEIIIQPPKELCKTLEYPFAHNLHTLKDISLQKRTPFRLLSDGSAVIKSGRVSWVTLERGTFCMDGAQYFPDENELYTGLESDTVILECVELEEEFEPPPHRFLYGGALLTSAVCLGVTVLVNGLVLENRDAYRWALLSYLISFFFMQIFLALGHLLPNFVQIYMSQLKPEVRENPKLHVNFKNPAKSSFTFTPDWGIAAQLFYLLTFSWLTVISFDIWETLRHVKKIRQKVKRGIPRFVAYILYSFAVSTAVVVTSISMDYIYGDDLEGTVVVPEFGKESCFLEPTYRSFYYLYLPVGILLGINTSFFLLTTYNICSAQHSAIGAADGIPIRKTRISVFVRLYFIMGIPFVFELISWVLTKDNSVVPWYIMIVDVFIILQGLAIMCLLCLTARPRAAILKKCPKLKQFTDTIRSMSSSMTSLVKKDNEIYVMTTSTSSN